MKKVTKSRFLWAGVLLLVLGLLILVCLYGWNKPLNRIDPAKIDKISIRSGMYGTDVTYTTPEEIAAAVECLNALPVKWQRKCSVEELESGDWAYAFRIKKGSSYEWIAFDANWVELGDTRYYTRVGYLREYIDELETEG